jgi:hypothetical protein
MLEDCHLDLSLGVEALPVPVVDVALAEPPPSEEHVKVSITPYPHMPVLIGEGLRGPKCSASGQPLGLTGAALVYGHLDHQVRPPADKHLARLVRRRQVRASGSWNSIVPVRR